MSYEPHSKVADAVSGIVNSLVSAGPRTKVFTIPEIIKMYNDMQAGKEIPVSPRTVYNRMKKNNISSRNDGSYARLDWKWIDETNVFNVLKDVSYEELETTDYSSLIALENLTDYANVLSPLRNEFNGGFELNTSKWPKGLRELHKGMIDVRNSKEAIIERIKDTIEMHGLQEHFVYKD